MAVVWLVFLAALALGWLLLYPFGLKRDRGVPVYWGLRVALEFAIRPSHLLERCRREAGDIFYIRAGMRTMLIIGDGSLFSAVCANEERFSFVQSFIPAGSRLFRLSEEYHNCSPRQYDLMGLHHAKMLKGSLVDGDLFPRLRACVDRHLDSLEDGVVVDLRLFAFELAFDSTIRVLFGNAAADDRELFEAVQVFDSYAKALLAGVPHALMPWVQKALKKMQERAVGPDLASSGFEAMIKRTALVTEWWGEQVAREGQAGLIWASTVNTVPSIFWALARLASNGQLLHFEAEVTSRASLKGDQVLQSFIKEVFRFYMANFNGRICMQDTELIASDGTAINVSTGTEVLVSPYMLHFDPDVFSNPTTFDANRFVGNPNFSKNGQHLSRPVTPFGAGGAHYCPGRVVANVEMSYIIAKVHQDWILKPLDPLPEPSRSKDGLGALDPSTPMRVQFVKKVK
jgi:cytochrome P450